MFSRAWRAVARLLREAPRQHEYFSTCSLASKDRAANVRVAAGGIAPPHHKGSWVYTACCSEAVLG
eukprot:354821-Pyramimonas_sp.AAC.2